MRTNNVIVERPQHMWMRVALAIHGADLNKVKTTSDLMSQKYFTHATPTLFNAGTPRPQLSSCYLIGMQDDSIDGIFDTLKDCAKISKWSGGIGLHIHNIRSFGSHIRGTNGVSNGIIPMLGVYNKTARYVDQGGKRNGSFAIYLEPHHPDIEEYITDVFSQTVSAVEIGYNLVKNRFEGNQDLLIGNQDAFVCPIKDKAWHTITSCGFHFVDVSIYNTLDTIPKVVSDVWSRTIVAIDTTIQTLFPKYFIIEDAINSLRLFIQRFIPLQNPATPKPTFVLGGEANDTSKKYRLEC